MQGRGSSIFNLRQPTQIDTLGTHFIFGGISMRLRVFLVGVLTICSFNPVSAEVHHFKAVQGSQTYAVREPILRIKPGDILETNTLYSDFFTAKDGPWPGEVGPIYVEGATPNDTLVVKIIKTVAVNNSIIN